MTLRLGFGSASDTPRCLGSWQISTFRQPDQMLGVPCSRVSVDLADAVHRGWKTILPGWISAFNSQNSLDFSYLHCDGMSSHGDINMKTYTLKHFNVQDSFSAAGFRKKKKKVSWHLGLYGIGVMENKYQNLQSRSITRTSCLSDIQNNLFLQFINHSTLRKSKFAE